MSSSPKEASLLGLMVMGLTAVGSLIAAPLAMLSLSPKPEVAMSHAAAPDPSTAVSTSRGAPQFEWTQRFSFGSAQSRTADPKERLLATLVDHDLVAGHAKNRTDLIHKLKSRFQIDGLVATLPDPLDSSNSYWFDLQLAVLRRAASTHGYSLDRFELPWSPSGNHSKNSQDADKDQHRREPGLLVFRRHQDGDAKSDLLLLYLVGETSTAGIQPEAFRKAVKSLLNLRTSDPSDRLRVLGPIFTGSANSLADAIRTFEPDADSSTGTAQKTQTKFRVVCGSANAVDWNWFEKQTGSRAQVHSTRPTLTALRGELLKFVRERDLSQRPIRIAWLVESSSFGNPSKKTPADQEAEVVDFAFPFHVSRVRNALQAQPSGDSKKKLPAFAPTDSKLEISQSEVASPQDVIPTYSAITPAYEELLLRQTMTTIQRDGFRYVGITATDPLDMAFLAELVHSHCPDAQLLLISGANSFLHPKQRGFLRGALLATGYPLHHETQHWTFPWGANSNPDKNTQWMFASDRDSTTGVYNAAVMLLANQQESRWCGNQFSLPDDPQPLQLVDYGSPFVTSEATLYRPPVWISTVGHAELIPVKVSAATSTADSYLVQVEVPQVSRTQTISRIPSIHFPLSGAFLTMILIVASLLTFLIVVEVRLPSHSSGAPLGGDCDGPRGWWPTHIDLISPLLRQRSDPAGGRLLLTPRAKQSLALLTPSVAMFGFCVWMSWLCQVICGLEWGRRDAKSGWLLTAALLLLALFLLLRFLPAKCPPPRVKLSSLAGMVLLTSAGIVLFAAWAYGFPWGLNREPLWTGWGFFWGSVGTAACALFWLMLSLCLMYDVSKSNSHLLAKCLAWPAFLAVISGPLLCILTADNSASAKVIRFLQTMSLTNGVSLIPPALCLMIALCLWSGFILRRLWLAESTQKDLPPWSLRIQENQNPLVAVSNRMAETVDFLQELLTTGCQALRRNFTVHFFFIVSAGVLWLAHMSRWSAVAFDTRELAWAVWVIGGVVALAWMHTFWQAIVLRRMIHKLLRQIAWMPPLTDAIARLPERVRVVVGHFLDIRQRRPSYLRVRVHYAKFLEKHHDRLFPRSDSEVLRPYWTDNAAVQNLQDLEQNFVQELHEAPSVISHECLHSGLPMQFTVGRLSEFGQWIWRGLLEEWHERAPRDIFPKSTAGRDEISNAIKQLAAELKGSQASAAFAAAGNSATRASNFFVNISTNQGAGCSEESIFQAFAANFKNEEGQRGPAKPLISKTGRQDWIDAAEELVATQVVNYLRGVLSFFYGQIWFLLGMTILFVLTMMLWPLQPQRQLMGTAVAMLAAVTAFCVSALFALERDRVHSILRGTTPDRVDFDRTVLLKLFMAVAPAGLLVLSYVFPGPVQWVFSFIEPLAAN